MVEFDCYKKNENDGDYREDLKIEVPYELKKYIIAEMLELYIDNETINQLHQRDGRFQLKDISIEFKNGWRFTNGKLPFEIYVDFPTCLAGNLSEANADLIIFVKKYKDNPKDVDIFIMDYKKLVKWWWEDGVYKEYEPYQIKNKHPTYDKERNMRWHSSFYPVIINRIPSEIILKQKRFFNTSFLYNKNDLSYFCRNGGK